MVPNQITNNILCTRTWTGENSSINTLQSTRLAAWNRSHQWLRKMLVKSGVLSKDQLSLDEMVPSGYQFDKREWLKEFIKVPAYTGSNDKHLKNLVREACGRKGPDDEASREFVKFFLERYRIAHFDEMDVDVDVDVQGRHGIGTALSNCVYSDRVETAKILLKHGARIDYEKDKPDMIPFISIAVHRENYQMVALLLKYGINVKNASMRKDFLVTRVIKHADVEIMKLLIAAGFDPYLRWVEGNPSLLYGVHMRAVRCEKGRVQMLPHPIGSLPFRYRKRIELIRFLMEIGCTAGDCVTNSIPYHGFLTLAFFYKSSLDMGRVVVWPLDFKYADTIYTANMNYFQIYRITKPISSTHASILRDMIRRTRSQCVNADKMIQYLNIQADGFDKIEIPTLVNLSIDRVRNSIAKKSVKIDQGIISELPLPKKIKGKICLADLDKRMDEACCSLSYFS